MTNPDASYDRALRRIRALLDRADHPNTPPPEADSARVLAEKLMRDYRVEEESLLARDVTAVSPELVSIEVCPSRTEFRNQYATLLYAIAEHVGVKTKYAWGPNNTLLGQCVGYPFDLRVAEVLFTRARVVFAEHLEPKPDKSLSDAENCYRMRSAGMERNRIAQLLWNSEPNDGAAHGRVAKLYKLECERRGESAALSGRGVSAANYREAYAWEFVHALDNRLQRARNAADKEGGALTLFGRTERVAEFFYGLYPEQRPAAIQARQEPAECEGCKKSKHDSGKCRDHRPRAWTKKDEAAWQRRQSAEAQAGRDAGRSAAQQVAIEEEGRRPQRLSEGDAEFEQTKAAIKGVLGR